MAITATLKKSPKAGQAVMAAVAAAPVAVIVEKHSPDGVLDVETVTTIAGELLPVAGTDAPAPPLTTHSTRAEIQRATSTAVGRPAPPPSEGAFEGEFDSQDVKFPTLTIVQGSTGALVERFAVGTLVLGDDELFEPPKPTIPSPVLRFIPCKVTKNYMEELGQEDRVNGVMPRFARSVEEVESLGGTTCWIGKTPPTFSPSARIVMLVEAPADTSHPAFGLDIDGKNYCFAVYYAKRRAYDATAKVLKSAYEISCFVPELGADGKPLLQPNGRPFTKRCLWKSVWGWTWGQVKAGDFKPWRPKFTQLKDDASEAVRRFISQSMSFQEANAGDAAE